MKENEINKEQIILLKKLNTLLVQKEKEIYNRFEELFETYQKRLKKNGGDLDDYEIEVLIEYYARGYRRCFCDVTLCKWMFESEVERKIIQIASGEDYSDRPASNFPDIGENCCYLMHALYFHSKMKVFDILKIHRVDFEIQIIEQQFVSIEEADSF